MPVFPLIAAAALGSLGYWLALTSINGRPRAGEPPLVRGALPFLGVALEFGRNPTTFITRCRERHGEVFTLHIGGQRMTFVLDPLSYPAVLKAKQLSFLPISDSVMATAFKFPDVREKVDIEAIEDLARARLKGPDLAEMTGAMERRLRELIGAGADGEWQTQALYRAVWDTMYHAGTDALFGAGLVNPAQSRAFQTFDRKFPLMVAGLPRFLFKAGDAALDQLANGPKLGANPSPWLRSRDTLLTDLEDVEHGRAQAAILWAINANTIPATFWSLYYLLRDGQGLAAVRAELEAVVGGLGPNGELPELGVETLAELRMLDSAVREALRLSSGSMTVREVLEPFVLETRVGQFALRAGDRVCIAPFITHRDPELFEDPDSYRHDRFYVESGVKQFYKGGERVPLALMPFGAGHSMCPGRFFAANEIKLFIAMTLLACEIEPVDQPIPKFDYSRAGLGIYPPVTDVEVRIRRRPAPAISAA